MKNAPNHKKSAALAIRAIRAATIAAALILMVDQVCAGADLGGPVQQLWIAPDGKLWFTMSTTASATYCQPGWAGFNMYVPPDNPQYPYYYGLLATAVSKGKNVYVGNISVYNGTGPCDITKTGYGLWLY